MDNGDLGTSIPRQVTPPATIAPHATRHHVIRMVCIHGGFTTTPDGYSNFSNWEEQEMHIEVLGVDFSAVGYTSLEISSGVRENNGEIWGNLE